MRESVIIPIPDKSLLKSRILKAGIAQHQKVIDGYRKRINEIIAGKDAGQQDYNPHHHFFRAETMAEVNGLSDQLRFADHELEQLLQVRPYYDENHSCAEYGTVVKTDKDNFFISSGTERFLADGFPVFGISVHSRLFDAMKGKKVGEYFTHNGIIHHVEEIF